MRRILSFITVFALLLTACEGPQGPPGFDGPQGPPGREFVGSAFEIVIDFTPANNYEFIEPYGFEVLPADVTLVYILWETINGQDVWRLVPQTVEFNDGNLYYNYDFTQTDVRFFLEGSTNLDALDDAFTFGQVFRVVVVPADNVGRTDFSDLDEVIETYNITDFTRR